MIDRTNAIRQARFRARQRGEELWSENMTAPQRSAQFNREQAIAYGTKEFCELARLLAKHKGNFTNALVDVKDSGLPLPRVREILQAGTLTTMHKAAASAGST